MINLPDYLLGKIEPNLRRCIEEHLDSCEKCRLELEELREPVTLLGGIAAEMYPDAFWQQLRASIMDAVSNPKPKSWRVPAFAGGLAVLLLAIGFGIYRLETPSVARTPSVAALAASLPADEMISLPSLNTNYTDVTSSPSGGVDEMDAVDDSVQEEVVKSMWTSLADSTASLDNIDYSANPILN